MEKMLIEVSDELGLKLTPYRDKLSELIQLGWQQLKIQEALTLYKRGIISFERAAELAELSIQEMIRQARSLGIQPHWSEEMVQEELA